MNRSKEPVKDVTLRADLTRLNNGAGQVVARNAVTHEPIQTERTAEQLVLHFGLGAEEAIAVEFEESPPDKKDGGR
jgi:hypothetical protein